MGIFNFMKKSKYETTNTGMDLPPIPQLEGLSSLDEFPDMRKQEIPPLPESMLPPLPSEVPRQSIQTMELPEQHIEDMHAPDFNHAETESPEHHDTEQIQETKPEFPTAQKVSEEFIPDRIPPLEGLDEPPRFQESMIIPTNEETHVKKLDEQDLPQTYVPQEIETNIRRRPSKGPMFIRTDQFKTISENIEMIRSKFSEEDDLFFRITEIKNAQDQKYEEFRQTLEDMQRKLLFIDKSLFEIR